MRPWVYAWVMLGGTGAALAADSVCVVAVPDKPAAARQVTEVERTVEAELSQRGIPVVGKARLVSKEEGDSAKASQRGRELLNQAQRQLDELALREAKETLNRAVVELEKADLGKDRRALLDAFVLKALAAQLGGDENEARDWLAKVFAIDITHALDKKRQTPMFMKLVDRMRSKAESDTGVSWSVDSKPTAADVELDGLPLGTTPLSPVGIPAGLHYVRISAPGFQTQRERVMLAEGKALKFDLKPIAGSRESLARREALATAFATEEKPRAALRDFIKFCDSDRLWVFRVPVDEQPLRLLVVDDSGDVKDEASVRLAERELNAMSTASKSLVAKVLGGSPSVSVQAEPPPETGGPGSAPVIVDTNPEEPGSAPLSGLRIAGFSLVGVGAAAGIGGLVAGLMASGQVNDAHTRVGAGLITPAQELVELNAAKGKALVADILYGAAIASAVTGVVLLVVGWPKAGGEETPAVGLVPTQGGAALTVAGVF